MEPDARTFCIHYAVPTYVVLMLCVSNSIWQKWCQVMKHIVSQSFLPVGTEKCNWKCHDKMYSGHWRMQLQATKISCPAKKRSSKLGFYSYNQASAWWQPYKQTAITDISSMSWCLKTTELHLGSENWERKSPVVASAKNLSNLVLCMFNRTP